MKVPLRRFSEQGIQEFENLVVSFRASRKIDDTLLFSLVFSDNFTNFIEDFGEIDMSLDVNKFQFAKSISEILNLPVNKVLDRDKGLWTWISALMLKKLVTINEKTQEAKFGNDNALYVYDHSWKRYYRHLIAFPCLVFSTLGENGRVFLRGKISERGEIVEQLASVQEVQRNPGVIEAITILYYDPIKDDVVRGAASKPNENKDIGGQARRLREVLGQFALTFDLNAMSGPDIVNLLPKEFDRWKVR